MATIMVHAAGLEGAITLTLAPGQAALLGRDPDLDDLTGDLSAELRGRIEQVVVASPGRYVSKNHLLIRAADDGTISIQDLRSANGTWLKLSPAAPTTVIGPAGVAIHLANPALADRTRQGPAEARWKDRGDFGESVRVAIKEWLASLGIDATVTAQEAGAAKEDLETFALADATELRIVTAAGKTRMIESTELLQEIRSYIFRENALLNVEEGHDEGFILTSPLFRKAHREVAEAASLGTNLVLIGETGAGKEDLAKCYHTHSSRSGGPFVVLHCGNLAGDIGYVDLFGAVAGGAQGIAAKAGAVEDANHGTLFLDELAELKPHYQVALLRFLNHTRDAQGNPRKGEFSRLGDAKRSQLRFAEDVNIVCATNVNLEDAQVRQAHGFRLDLWHRMAEHIVRVPRLEKRPEDVLAYLAMHPRDQAVKLVDALEPAALKIVLSHAWPGNFRELRSFARSPALPRPLRPRCVSAALCREALQHATDRVPESGPPPMDVSLPSGFSGQNWAKANAIASQAFEEDNGALHGALGKLDDYVRLYLKPVMVAYASGLEDLQTLSKDINYSELARKLHFKDGTTVRLHLRRYLERFRR